MNEYSRIKIPRNTKVGIKVMWFYLIDILIVASLLMIGYYLNMILPFQPKFKFMFQALNFFLGVFLCLPSSLSPQKKTIQIVYRIFIRDTRKFLTLNYVRRGELDG